MNHFFAYTMQYTGDTPVIDSIPVRPFREEDYAQYERVYNACFYEMRKALEIKPYNFYSDIEQIRDKMANIFLLMMGETLVGSVACYGTEIDDLIVRKEFRNKGYGKTLLLWAVAHIRTYSDEPITLHVAEWNQGAIKLYQQNGFVVTRKERIN